MVSRNKLQELNDSEITTTEEEMHSGRALWGIKSFRHFFYVDLHSCSAGGPLLLLETASGTACSR